MIGYCFLLIIPITFFVWIIADDHGLFLPRTGIIDMIVPDSFIYIKNDYELRCFEGQVSLWLLIYFTSIGILNIEFWRNNSKINLRVFHAIVTIGLAITFFMTMVEGDTYHYSKIAEPFGKQQYESKVFVFYNLLLFWLVIQVIYFIAFFREKLIENK